ncbi:MAG: hypothetical protein WKG07_06820 [Hymenobacter sp.]
MRRRDLTISSSASSFRMGCAPLAVSLPALAGRGWGWLDESITVAIGALCLSIPDYAGAASAPAQWAAGGAGAGICGALLVGWLAALPPWR